MSSRQHPSSFRPTTLPRYTDPSSLSSRDGDGEEEEEATMTKSSLGEAIALRPLKPNNSSTWGEDGEWQEFMRGIISSNDRHTAEARKAKHAAWCTNCLLIVVIIVIVMLVATVGVLIWGASSSAEGIKKVEFERINNDVLEVLFLAKLALASTYNITNSFTVQFMNTGFLSHLFATGNSTFVAVDITLPQTLAAVQGMNSAMVSFTATMRSMLNSLQNSVQSTTGRG